MLHMRTLRMFALLLIAPPHADDGRVVGHGARRASGVAAEDPDAGAAQDPAGQRAVRLRVEAADPRRAILLDVGVYVAATESPVPRAAPATSTTPASRGIMLPPGWRRARLP